MDFLKKYVCEHGKLKRFKSCNVCDHTDYEINKEIVFSANHVTEDTGIGLENSKTSLVIINTTHSWRIYVGDDENLDSLGDYPELKTLAKIAKSKGCIWLVLDESGPVYSSLPIFYW